MVTTRVIKCGDKNEARKFSELQVTLGDREESYLAVCVKMPIW